MGTKEEKYTFNIVCSEDIVGGESRYKRIKLVGNVNDEEKTITFCGPYIGACNIVRKQNGQESFKLWVEKAKYNFRGDDLCNSWTDGKLYHKENIPLEEVKLKVILDEDCEYKIAVSVEDNQWITLPKSVLFGENLNLKRYYDQEISLSRGERFSSWPDPEYYIPKVMCGQTKICELTPLSFPNCDRGQVELDCQSYPWIDAKNNKIVVEKNGAGELSICFADKDGKCLANLNEAHGRKNIIEYVNSVLKTVLLENSNIREVLPELNIGDGVDIDRRQLKCLVHNVVPKEVAQELVTNKKDELGRAVLEVKNGDEEILVNSPILQEGIAKKLRENPGNAKGPKGEKGDAGEQGQAGQDGESPSAAAVATQLLTDSNNKNTLVTGVAGNSDLRTAVVTNLKRDTDFRNSVKGDKGTDGISPDVGKVAQELVTNKKDELGKAVLGAKNGDKEILVNNPILQEGIAKKLRENPGNAKGPKGEDGAPGPAGQAGNSPSAEDVATQLLTGEKKIRW